MPAALLIRLRPTGPWRIGPDSGDRDRVDRVYHSDSLYSAIASAMLHLGQLEEWLDATARAAEPAVRLGSCFPFQGDTLLVAPPRNLWPPPASSKVRWKSARFVPLSVVEALVAGRGVSEDRWMIDGASECLVPMTTPPVPGPFRVNVRSNAAADRNGTAVAPHSTACLEFTPSSGLWTVASFSNDAARERWTAPVTAAFRLLADSGFGGERSNGWGRSETPEITAGELSHLLLKSPAPASSANAWWLLSLFHPADSDSVDWTQGNYALTTRGGRVESGAGWGEQKKATRMVAEGSVIVAAAEPRGSATDVAPAIAGGFAHPVYRAGFALAIPIPLRGARAMPLASTSLAATPPAATSSAASPVEAAPPEATPAPASPPEAEALPPETTPPPTAITPTTPDATTPDATTPDAIAPDTTAPDAIALDTTAPDITANAQAASDEAGPPPPEPGEVPA